MKYVVCKIAVHFFSLKGLCAQAKTTPASFSDFDGSEVEVKQIGFRDFSA